MREKPMDEPMADVLERAPDLDIDPYDDAFIADPQPGHAAMRNVGPTFYMLKYAAGVPPIFAAVETIAASRPFEQNQDGQLRNSSKQASKTSVSETSAIIL
jgi:hypothetical protein